MTAPDREGGALRARMRRFRATMLLFGAALGLGLSLLAQLVVATLGVVAMSGQAPTFWQRAAGVLLTAAGHALVLGVSGAIACHALRLRRGELVAVAGMAVVVTLLVATHGFGVVVRVLSGSYMTVGAIEFADAMSESLLQSVGQGYTLEIAVLAAACVLAAAGSRLLLVRSLRAAARGLPSRRVMAGSTLTALGFALLITGPTSASFARGVWRTTPELAFLASIDLPSALPTELEDETRPRGPAVSPGLPLITGGIWEGAIAVVRPTRPNVLLVTLESVAISHLGYLGYARPVTPNLDRLAAEGWRMRRAWATATHSNYAQMAILSSLFPRRSGSFDQYTRLDYPRVLYHDVFHRLGFATATISSQDERWQGMRRFETTATPTFFWSSTEHTGPHVDILSEQVVPDAITVDRAIAWILEQQGPWALYLNLQGAHFPYVLPEGADAPFQPTETEGDVTYLSYSDHDRPIVANRYDNALHHVDRQVGRLAAHLRDTGQLDETLWVVTSDHGELFGEHGVVTHGKTLYEGEARVPLFLRWPGRLAPRDIDAPVSHLDVLPTITELVGAPQAPAFQGTSFADEGAHRAENRAVFANIQGLRTAEAIVCWPYKLILERTSRETLLFDLAADPGELRDLSTEEVGIASALGRVLAAQIDAQVAYHAYGSDALLERFAPRLGACPDLP